ncbi:MAG: GNAT family N-acetyltransferase, partial [Lachnospiraceae bacterium]|nr:GNAT family N-acetyltransferase [Lachnospiraceae bacterium]
MSISLRKIREEDLEAIMNWRMDPDITRYMNTDPKLTLEGQRKWLSSIENNPDVFYRLIEIDNMPAGVINLTGLLNKEGNLGWA